MTPEQKAELDRFPRALRELALAEIAAGNAIDELGHGFPAAPCGAWLRLSGPVTTRARVTSGEMQFVERNSSQHSGEFTDERRHYFIVEPPRPREDEDADLTARMAALRHGVSPSGCAVTSASSATPAPGEPPSPTPDSRSSSGPKLRADSVVDRFRASMVMDHERWREGTGYDIALVACATPEERLEIEQLLVNRGVDDWRDVEALAALDTPRARSLLRTTLETGRRDLACAVVRHAPHLVTDAERTATLVAALEELEFDLAPDGRGVGGLTQALIQIESHHPPEVIDALLRGVLHRSGMCAYHFGAMLLFAHGIIESRWNMDERPFLLTLGTDDLHERRERFRALCARLGVDPLPFLRA